MVYYENKGQGIIQPEQWKNLKVVSTPQEIWKLDRMGEICQGTWNPNRKSWSKIHPQSYGMQFQHKMVYQCILYVLFQDVETGFHSVPLNAFVFFFGLNPSKVLVDITIVDKSWKNLVIYPLVM